MFSKGATKVLKSVVNNRLLLLFVSILLAIVLFAIYCFFNPSKENFVGDISSIFNDPSKEAAIPMSVDSRDLLNSGSDLLGTTTPIKTTESELSRIKEIEGLCANFKQPSDLKNLAGMVYPGEACGWYYYEDPGKPSFPAYGNSSGPLNPELADVTMGGQWFFDNMDVAQKKENIKRCKRIRTCQLVDLYPGYCGWCDVLGYSIPIDPQSKRSLYPDDDEVTCQGKLTMQIDKCPILEVIKATDKDEDGNIIPSEVLPPPVCNAVNGKITRECLMFLAKGAGMLETGAVFRAIDFDPDGYLIKGTYPSRKWKIAWEIMKFRSKIVYDKEMMGGGNTTRDKVLKFYLKLMDQTTNGYNPRTRSVAKWLCFGEPFQTYEFALDSTGPFPLEMLQDEFKNAGGQAAGTSYPSPANIGLLNGNKLSSIISAFKKTCTENVNSADPAVQADAIKQCLGIDAPQPLAGCVASPAYNPKGPCTAGNTFIGTVTEQPTSGSEIFWYSYDNDLTFPEKRQQTATYYGRQIKLGIPTLASGDKTTSPFNSSNPMAFMARTIVKYSGPLYNAALSAVTTGGIALKVNGNIVLRNWTAGSPGTGVSNTFPLAGGSDMTLNMYAFFSNPPPSASNLSVGLVDISGNKKAIPPASCSLRVAKGYPVARWDFFSGNLLEGNGILTSSLSSVKGSIYDSFLDKKCLNFTGSNGYVITANKIAGSAFRSFTCQLYYNSVGSQGSNRIFSLRSSTSGFGSNETDNYTMAAAIEAGISADGSLFATLKPAGTAPIAKPGTTEKKASTAKDLLTVKTAAGLLTPKKWYHIAVVFSQTYNDITLYIDGSKKVTESGKVDTATYDNMIFDYGAIGMGYVNSAATTSNMAFNGGMAWQRWYDYPMCQEDIRMDMGNKFCDNKIYPILADYGWPMPCGISPSVSTKGIPNGSADGDASSSSDSKKALSITSASYGANCDPKLAGNRTILFQQLLTPGDKSLKYTYDYTKTGGDPAPGCPKTLEIDYNCDGVTNQKFTVPAEAGVKGLVDINCISTGAACPSKYDNAKIYKLNDVVLHTDGIIYKMTDGIGAAGYPPPRPTNWTPQPPIPGCGSDSKASGSGSSELAGGPWKKLGDYKLGILNDRADYVLNKPQYASDGWILLGNNGADWTKIGDRNESWSTVWLTALDQNRVNVATTSQTIGKANNIAITAKDPFFPSTNPRTGTYMNYMLKHKTQDSSVQFNRCGVIWSGNWGGSSRLAMIIGEYKGNNQKQEELIDQISNPIGKPIINDAYELYYQFATSPPTVAPA